MLFKFIILKISALRGYHVVVVVVVFKPLEKVLMRLS